MAERSWCKIVIGGLLARANVTAFLELIESEGLGDEFEGQFTPEMLEVGKPLELFASETVGGMAEGLETFCRTHRLFYRRASGGRVGAYNPSIAVSFGDGRETEFASDEDEHVVVSAREILDATSLERLHARMVFATRSIPPFVIVDDPSLLAVEGAFGYVLATRDQEHGLSFWNEAHGFGAPYDATVFDEKEAISVNKPIALWAPEWMALPAPAVARQE